MKKYILLAFILFTLSVNAQLPNFCKWDESWVYVPNTKAASNSIPFANCSVEYKLSKNVLSSYIQLPESAKGTLDLKLINNSLNCVEIIFTNIYFKY